MKRCWRRTHRSTPMLLVRNRPRSADACPSRIGPCVSHRSSPPSSDRTPCRCCTSSDHSPSRTRDRWWSSRRPACCPSHSSRARCRRRTDPDARCSTSHRDSARCSRRMPSRSWRTRNQRCARRGSWARRAARRHWSRAPAAGRSCTPTPTDRDPVWPRRKRSRTRRCARSSGQAASRSVRRTR